MKFTLLGTSLLVGAALQGVRGQDDNKYCVTEARATDIIRLWDEELGGTKISSVVLPTCDDKGWSPIERNQQNLRSDMWNQAADVLTEELMPTLADQFGDAENYLCPDGIKWYTLNDFKGCALNDGETFEYRSKKYKAKGNDGVMTVGMTLSYVCNGGARRKDVGLSYTTVTKTDCRPNKN